MNLRQFFDRYGVSLGVLAILAVLIAVLPPLAQGREPDRALDPTGGPPADTRSHGDSRPA